MKATIKPYQSGVHKGHMIVLTDDQGAVVEKIAVTEVEFDSNPWPTMILVGRNAVRFLP